MEANKMKTYRWIVFGCLAAIYFMVFFHRLSLGTIKVDLMDSFAMSATVFANLGAMYFYPYLIMQIPAGILADTFSPRLIITAGGLVTTAGTVLFAFSPSVTTVFMARLLIGLGVSVIYVSILKIHTYWFRESEFGTMVGLTGFFGNMGGIAAQTPLALLVALLTWRHTFLAIGLFSLGLAVLCLALVRNKPQDMGLPSIREIEGRTEPAPENQAAGVKEGILGVLKNPGTWLVFTVLSCYCGVYYAFAGTWGVSFIRTVYHLGNVRASEYITLLVVGISLGYLTIGFISDRLRSRKIPLISLGILTNGLWWVMLFYQGGRLPLQALGAAMLILGISTACFSLSFSLSKESNDGRYAGMAVSVVNMGAFLGGAVVPVLVGRVIDLHQGLLTGIGLYRQAFLICLILNALGLLASLFIKETHCRNIYRQSAEPEARFSLDI